MRQIGNQRYTLVRELGRGGMGVVWLAEDTVLGRPVAVKELIVPESERGPYQERVLREARIAGRLANPAIVRVYDLIRENDDTFIVMEYVQAPTLTELVEAEGPMPVAKAARLAAQLLSALEAAHDAGIVHRDVKPGNVMVPAKDSAKLTDFGIAQSFEDPRLTTTGMLIGSPAYMSPERLEGGQVTAGWDLWALGATLFFAVEGYSAYQRANTSATMLAVMTEYPQPRLAHGPMAQLIMGLLERDPERRLGTHRAHSLIEEALSAEPVDPPTNRLAPVGKPKKNRKPLYAASISVVLVAAFAAAVVMSLNSKADPESLPRPTFSFTMPTPTTAAKVTSKAMMPVMTHGPGGDIPDLSGAMISGECHNDWVPKKGAKDPDFDTDVGCYGPHDVEVLEQDWANRDLEKEVPYPPFEQLVEETTQLCTRIFLSEAVPVPNKEETLKFWVIVPNTEAWKVKTSDGYRMSNRLTYCFVGKADGSKLTEPIMAR
ncbi:serine/threonine protein kinase [Kibdelosporangium philippinense]|uniref:non-specific serine/threonine protein kinase n=1 Tax=Kibdelosporangium philippinense TaxID=211113 RepID=A0ABS8ZTY4_9PSEU|nr:serine/threonine-protein kinase [Kibdelosporangium philippinense]MCE7011166.1 serine/threonine protein kinase [Kibdelosporangium philippinense]